MLGVVAVKRKNREAAGMADQPGSSDYHYPGAMFTAAGKGCGICQEHVEGGDIRRKSIEKVI